MDDSILNSIKKLLGITEEYTAFNQDIIMHINSVFMILNQLGVGPTDPFAIEDETAVWSDFLEDPTNFEAVKSYIYLKVRLLFDPPLTGTVTDAIKSNISELEWRLNVQADSRIDSEETE